ncbi:protein angel isoform X1 [Haemaphysalis longicornis]
MNDGSNESQTEGADGRGLGDAAADGVPRLGRGRARPRPLPAAQHGPLPRVHPPPPGTEPQPQPAAAMWPGAACRLIRPPVFVFPPAAAAAAQCSALLHWTHLWPFNLGTGTAAAPAPHWSFQGRAPLHAASGQQAAMSSAEPGLCPPDPSHLGVPCNNKRGPASPGERCEAKLKRRFPPDQADTMHPFGGTAGVAEDHMDTSHGPGDSTNCGPAETPGVVAEQYDPALAAVNVRQQVRKSRFWANTELGQLHNGGGGGGRAGDLVFTVLSYNVLAQGLLEDNPYLYQHCRQEVLSWPLRRHNLLAELREADADVLCLQELQEDHYETDFKPELEKMGYGCLYKRRTGNKHDGCGIFYRKSVFELDRFQAVEYSRSDVTVLDRDNVALIAMLKPVAGKGNFGSDFRLCVSTTHLLFNPRRGDIKLAQLCLLLAEIDRLASRGEAADGSPLYCPIVLCGDMNSEPHSPLYAFLTRGTLCYEGLLSGDVSGQSDGANRGRAIPLDDCLHQLHISGSSRYLPPEEDKKTPVEEDGAAPDVSKVNSSNEDAVPAGSPSKKPPKESPATDTSSAENTREKESRTSSPARAPSEASPARKPAAEEAQHGVVTHNLNLVSAYRHDVTGVHAEVTTHHQRASCTVDYIFYSVKRKETAVKNGRVVHNRVVEGPLRLLATYRLMSQKQLMAVGGLPNEVQSSDHLPLMAKYLLRQPS